VWLSTFRASKIRHFDPPFHEKATVSESNVSLVAYVSRFKVDDILSYFLKIYLPFVFGITV
jgi:hypothetical protein